MTEQPTQSLVFGATGFIGRWLVRQLLRDGEPVVAAVRTEAGAATLRRWLHGHDTDDARLRTVLADFQDPVSVIPTSELDTVRDVFNVAGGFAFGMSQLEAFTANVALSRAVVATASQVPQLRRLVHLSGYRVGGQDPSTVPWSASKRAREYQRLGAYEGSKVESDAVVQADARRLGVPLTIVNPATVIGDSVSGESEQLIGLADTVLNLSRRKLPAVPGNSTTFVPIITVDYLARFMTILPREPQSSGCSYWVLDDSTPPLPRLLSSLAGHLGVSAPRLQLPVWLIRALPRSITKADPETMSFLSSDRYPTGPATALAARHGLEFPDVETSLGRWADYLVKSTQPA